HVASQLECIEPRSDSVDRVPWRNPIEIDSNRAVRLSKRGRLLAHAKLLDTDRVTNVGDLAFSRSRFSLVPVRSESPELHERRHRDVERAARFGTDFEGDLEHAHELSRNVEPIGRGGRIESRDFGIFSVSG